VDSCTSTSSTCRCLALRVRQCAWLNLFRAIVLVRPRVSGNQDRATGKKLVRFRGTNETSVSVVNHEPTVNCGMGSQGHTGTEGKNPVCVRSVRIKQEEREMRRSRPSGCDLVSATKSFATCL